jgi:multicomponent K+:H+ antiporter subunit G
MTPIVEGVVAVLLVLGGLIAAIGSLGVVTLPKFLSRVHGPSVSITGGLGTLLVGGMVWFWATGDHITGREVFVSFILAITAPVTAHAMSRAWLKHHPKPALDTQDQCDD